MANSKKKDEQLSSLREKANKPTFRKVVVQRMIKNPMVVVLIVAIIVGSIFFVKLYFERNRISKEKTELTLLFKQQSDSIRIKNMEFNALVFSWSVRSEMMRNNMENLNQLFTIFTQKSGADRVQLVTIKDNIISISSDKKFEGEQFKAPLNIDLNKPTTLTDSNQVSIYVPIMGLNARIGLLKTEVHI